MKSGNHTWRQVTFFDGFFVYALWGTDEERPLYIGKSTNVMLRVGTHLADPKKRYHVRRVSVMRCYSQEDMDKTEVREINKLNPSWNRVGFDDAPVGGFEPRPWEPQRKRPRRKGVSVPPSTGGSRRAADALQEALGHLGPGTRAPERVHFMSTEPSETVPDGAVP